MFYIKDKLYGAIEVTTQINENNVFCRCPYCGTEVQVNILKALDNAEYLRSAAICGDCRYEAKGGLRNGKSV